MGLALFNQKYFQIVLIIFDMSGNQTLAFDQRHTLEHVPPFFSCCVLVVQLSWDCVFLAAVAIRAVLLRSLLRAIEAFLLFGGVFRRNGLMGFLKRCHLVANMLVLRLELEISLMDFLYGVLQSCYFVLEQLYLHHQLNMLLVPQLSLLSQSLPSFLQRLLQLLILYFQLADLANKFLQFHLDNNLNCDNITYNLIQLSQPILSLKPNLIPTNRQKQKDCREMGVLLIEINFIFKIF